MNDTTQPDQNQPAPDPIDYHGRDKADPSTWDDADRNQGTPKKKAAPAKKAAAAPPRGDDE